MRGFAIAAVHPFFSSGPAVGFNKEVGVKRDPSEILGRVLAECMPRILFILLCFGILSNRPRYGVHWLTLGCPTK